MVRVSRQQRILLPCLIDVLKNNQRLIDHFLAMDEHRNLLINWVQFQEPGALVKDVFFNVFIINNTLLLQSDFYPEHKWTLTQIPLLSTKAGPRDGAAWTQRLKEEYKALIAYTQMNKSNDNDWFRISAANPEGTRWTGKCWYVHNLLKYEFDLQFDIPVTYPATAPELELPQLDGKTQKMYRGGKICLTVHFKPLWAKNCPRFGIAHALCLGLAPWLAAEIPILVDSGMIKHRDDVSGSSES